MECVLDVCSTTHVRGRKVTRGQHQIPLITGNYSICFDNTFSVVTNKVVEVNWEMPKKRAGVPSVKTAVEYSAQGEHLLTIITDWQPWVIGHSTCSNCIALYPLVMDSTIHLCSQLNTMESIKWKNPEPKPQPRTQKPKPPTLFRNGCF